MALVRRADLLAPAQTAVVPIQSPPGGADAPPPSLTTALPAWAANAEAAAVASRGAGIGTVAFGFVLVAAGAVVAWALQRYGTRAGPFKIGNQTSAYAGVVVFAGAVERFLEPFAHWLPGARARDEYESAVAALTNGHPGVSLGAVATAKARMDRAQANRTVLLWALATAVATAAAGASGFYLLHMIAASDWSGSVPLPVLMYHSVSTVDGHLRDLAVPKDRLREQLGALADAGYALVGLTEALHDNGTRAVAVTFDDGYVDFLDGLDVLREVGATATLYVCPGHIGDRMALGPLLSWDQVREVAAAGIEIGNHSLRHHPLDVLPEPVLDKEIRESSQRLAEELGAPARSFAYPHGYHSGRVRAAVARYGHDNACEVGRRLYE